MEYFSRFIFIINLSPKHPEIHDVFKLSAITHGDIIQWRIREVAVLARGTEKLNNENKNNKMKIKIIIFVLLLNY